MRKRLLAVALGVTLAACGNGPAPEVDWSQHDPEYKRTINLMVNGRECHPLSVQAERQRRMGNNDMADYLWWLWREVCS
jgi:hypothetical protein